MTQNPFKFLDSYDKTDKDRFFGRNKETAQLFNALQVYLDRLFREDLQRQQENGSPQPERITFDPDLVQRVGPMQNVLSEFLDEQMKVVEDGLRKRGVSQPEGLPLEILFTLVTEDGTKRNRPLDTIVEDLPRHRQMRGEDVAYCLEEFKRIKLLRQFAEE